MSKTLLRHTMIAKYFLHCSWLPYLYAFSLYENASFIIVSAETEYISTRNNLKLYIIFPLSKLYLGDVVVVIAWYLDVHLPMD